MPTSTTITFTGLLVFHRDPATAEYEVGILRARDAHEPHFLQIEISPDPGGGQPPTPDQLEAHVQAGNVDWELDVEGSSSVGIQARPDKPGNRHNPTMQDDRDLGWMINLENDEFHDEPLERAPDGLQPVIRLKHGSLFTSCKTDVVETIQGRGTPRDFGFITGGITLEIDTSEGQQPVLSFVNQDEETVELFRLPQTDKVSYKVSIFNTPPAGTPITESHFHLYYQKLFTEVPENERFDIRVRNPQHPTPPPQGRCPEATESNRFFTPNPFRCGGILVEGDESLG